MTQEPTASSAEDTQPESVTINIKSSNAKYTLAVSLSTTANELKEKLAAPEYADVPATSQRLIYSGRVLKDGETLESHKVKDGNTIHLVKSAPSNQRQNPATQSAGSATGDSTSGSNVPRPSGVPSNIAAGTGHNPLAGLTGARYAGFAQLPGAGMFGPDGGMGPPPSQEQMIEMLSNPAFSQMMNEALQNPAMIDMMIQQNPQLRDMGPAGRQFLQSEQFRRMVTDPQSLRVMGQLQSAMGMGPFAGAGGGGQEAFPAPGVTTTTATENIESGSTESRDNDQNATSTNPADSNPAAPGANPFSALFGMPPPALNQTNPDGTSPPSSQPANPFSALFGMGQPNATPQQTPGQQGTDSPDNPPANPLLNMQNNPMFQNPELMNQFMQAMGGGGGPGRESGNATGGNPGGPNPLANLSALLGGGGMAGGGMGGAAAPPDNRAPEERYATQLRQLNEMGFFDFNRNIQALQRSGGDVNGALEWLFSQP